MLTTPATLLKNLTESPTQQLWADFYNIYWKAILGYCKKQGLNDADSRDVLQETMLAIFRILDKGGFKYDKSRGRFKNYLFQIVRHIVIDAYRRSKFRDSVSLDTLMESGIDPAADGLKPAEYMEKDWQYSLIESALARLYISPGVDRRTIDVFVDYAVRGMKVSEVAEKHHVNENAVYQIKNRVIKQLKREIEILNNISEKFNKI